MIRRERRKQTLYLNPALVQLGSLTKVDMLGAWYVLRLTCWVLRTNPSEIDMLGALYKSVCNRHVGCLVQIRQKLTSGVSKFDMLGVRYKFVNFGTGKSPVSTKL